MQKASAVFDRVVSQSRNPEKPIEGTHVKLSNVGPGFEYPLLQEPLKIKDANEKPGFEPVAYRKQGFPTENPVLLLKTHTKTIQNPYKTHTKPVRLYAFHKTGFSREEPGYFREPLK